MKGVCTILILIWINSPISAQQLSLSDQISFAKTLSESGNEHRALKEYLRAYFHDRENLHTNLAFTISQSFRQQGDYKNALLFIEKYLFQRDLKFDDHLDGVYEKVSLLMSAGLFKEAQLTLVGIRSELKQINPNRYNYYLSMCYVFSDQFDKAKRSLYKLDYIDQPNEIFAVDMLVDRLEEIANTNHAKARLLSMILPGLGQAVNGEPEDGLNSLALVGGLLIVFFEVSQSLTTVDALVSVGPWFGRYYLGGLQNATKASVNKMKALQKSEIQELNQYLQRKKSTQVEGGM